MKAILKRFTVVAMAFAMFAVAVLNTTVPAMAASVGLTVAPMNEKLIVNPGDSVQSSFKVSNPVDSKEAVEYELSTEPFYMKGGGDIVFGDDDAIEKEHTQIVDWVKFDVPTKGKLEPNEVIEVGYTITAPKSAPAGGQYVMITVTTHNKDDQSSSGSSRKNDSSTSIDEVKRMGHLVYAEVTGNTIKQGDVYDLNVPSFLLDGNIKGSATIKNTGNVHGDAKYSLQVFPLFSNEEVYTNEETPGSRTILPNRDYYAEVTWEDTPMMGIYNVVFKVEFEGETQEVKKMVIKMPVWMIFLIVFVIAFLIIWITMKVKNKGKKRNRATENTNNE